MRKSLDEAIKMIQKRENKFKIPILILQFIGIIILIMGIILKQNTIINLGTLTIGTGFILLAIKTLITKEIFKK